MNLMDTVELIDKYGRCPQCGCEVVGNGMGSLEFDTKIGYFKRTCRCGWSVEIKEGENG